MVALNALENLDAVVIGAGFFGLTAAHELLQCGLNVAVFEASERIGGCWHDQANSYSRVTVCEPSYRFPIQHDSLPNDYTPKEELLANAKRFVEEKGLTPLIHYQRTVASITEEQEGFLVTSSTNDGGQLVTRTKAVFLCVGAQTRRREATWPGEEAFNGSIAYGSGNEVRPCHDQWALLRSCSSVCRSILRAW